MKKFKLFLAACAAMVGLSANAQSWTGNTPTAGTFFLYNVGAAKFLNNGDPNSEWGTNAYLQAGFGMDIVLEAADENVYYLNTNVSNGGNSNYLANSTWCDGTATPWTFRAVEGETNVYQIINNGQYIMANEAGNDVEMVGDPAGRTISNTYWKLVSENDFKAAMQAKAYSASDPMDVSVFIKGRSFARNDGRNSTWVTSHNGGNWVWIGASENKYYGNESWNNTFDVHQAITGLPDGTYEVRCSGFGTNGTTYIYGNSKQGQLQTDNTTSYGTNKEAKWKAIHEDNAFAGQTTGTFTLSGGNLTVGIKRETNQNQDWCVYDEFRLYYYGLDLSEFVAELAAAVQAAEDVEGSVPTAAYNTLAAIVSENNKTYTTAADYTAAISAIETATNTAKALQPNYARYIKVRNAVLAVNNSINVSEANSQAEEATTAESLETAVQTVRTALANYLPTASLGEGETIDLTDALIDNAAPGVSGNTDFWTNSSNPGLQFNLWEYYQVSGGTTKQTIATSLPAGNYKLTAIAFTRTGYEAKLNAGENSTNIAQVASGTVNNREQGSNWIAEGNGNGVTDLVFNLAEATADLEIGLTADNSNGGDHWMCWRSFRLVYGDVFEPYTLVEGKMNAEVAAAQTTADQNFKNNPSPATYMAVQEAIAAAQASKDAYVPFTTAINKIDAALAAATTATESAESYNTIKTAYTNETITDADIQTNINAVYDAVIPVIKSQTAASADFTLAIQNQSFEYGDMTGWTATESSDTGVRETANATYAATGSDGDYLFNTWWQGVPLTQAVTGLPNGQYTLTASVSSDGATIYLLANGEHNDGTETGGEYPSSDTFQEATITFLVKDGNAIIGVVGGAGGDAGVHKDYVEEGYWWYKADNFRLVKNRNLTDEEAAVFPTAIALYNGETEVTEVVLDATNASVTLIPNFTPADATPSVTWTSSDETVAIVADGLVTAVSSGTAIIAVKSTLDENVSASATITVSFPESEVVSYVNDGATRTVYTFGENLFKNGSFDYPNALYGWTVKNTYTEAADPSNFTITSTGGVNNGAFVTTNAGGAGTATSLSKAIPVENGKKYYFAVYTSGKAPSTNNFAYNALFAMSSATAESSTLKPFEWPQGAEKTATEWSKTEFVFTATTDYVGVRMSWNASSSFDNFVLCEIIDETTIGNTQYALDAIPTTNVGTGAFQYSQDAIDAANALVQGTATVAEVEAAYEAVTKLNEPEPTQAYNLVFNCEGHSATGNALTLIPNPAQTQGLYGLKYLNPANVNLAQAFYFTHTTGNKYKVYAIDTDLNERYITTQAEGYGTTWYEGIRTIDDASKAMEIEIRPNGEGLYLLWNTGANKPIAHNGNNNNDFFTNNTANFQFVETAKPSITINTTAAGWGTTMLPFAVAEIPEGVKVYTCAEVESSSLTLVEVDALEANKPYIIEGKWNDTLTGDAQGTALNYTEGLLTGTYVEMDAEALNGKYIMQKQGEKVGFFLVNKENAQPKLRANRAYMTDPATEGSVKAFYLGENDLPTAIQSVFDGLVNGEAYDLAGRKVQKLQKGDVYIINGKKVVVK